LQDDASASNGNKDPLSFDGMADTEVERRLKVIYYVWNCWVYVCILDSIKSSKEISTILSPALMGLLMLIYGILLYLSALLWVNVFESICLS
jgi:hypothetical protein